MKQKFVELSQSKKKLREGEEDDLITHRDALIKRFEFCYDLTWKFCKLILKEKYSIDVTSPRKVFQECYQQGIFNEEETKKLLEMIEARNETSHIYDESKADAISQKIVVYYDFLIGIIKKLA
jgi:nucleotidyltransferase substrate binding protein (TIGR01987 family)